jgi:hypothetical protein
MRWSTEPHDQLEYMADMLVELKEMARKHKLETLVAILDMAHAEACLRAKTSIELHHLGARETS